MKILIVGSGGREHAIYNKFFNENNEVYLIGETGGVDAKYLFNTINVNEVDKIVTIAKDFDLVVVGPEIPLALGLIDKLQEANIRCFGPNKYCAQIETSKVFAKDVMQKLNVATAKYITVNTYEEGIKALKSFSFPVVFKYSGLAAGKGVLIINDILEATKALDEILNKKCFGSDALVIEEFLVGEEFSCFYIVNNGIVKCLGVAQDYKRAYDNDQGLNTGGMGAHTTNKFNKYLGEIESNIIKPVINELNYSGFLYAGLIFTSTGIKVIEFNCRLGDPETQVILPKINSSLSTAITDILNNKKPVITFNDQHYLGVVVAANGYPSAYINNIKLNEINNMLHMSTKQKQDLMSTGGRVFMLLGSAKTIKEAREKVYKKLNNYNNESLFYRNDIGLNKGEEC